jgi:integrase
MEKSLVVLAGGIEVLNEVNERCPVKVTEPGFDAVPANRFLLIPGHLTVLVRVLSRRVSPPSSWNLLRSKWRESVDTVQNINTPAVRRPWNKGKLVGPKPPLQPKHVWAIRTRLQMQRKVRDLALFNLAIDSKLRGCDVVSLNVEDIAPHGYAIERATVRQKTTGRPVRFEITEQSRQSVDQYLRLSKRQPGSFPFGGRRKEKSLTTRQYGRLVSNWTAMIGLDASLYSTHSLRRTKATLIYRKTGNLRAVQLLLGHSKVESTVRYLGIEVDDALTIAEQVDI